MTRSSNGLQRAAQACSCCANSWTGRGTRRRLRACSRGISSTTRRRSLAEIAAAQPEAFLETFEQERYRENSLVLTGLGQIDDPRATKRLARVAGSANEWVRMHVAIGLGRRASPIATATLVRLLEDDEFLVRHHALESLARVGDASALGALRARESRSPREAELTEQAIRSIQERADR